MDEHQHVVAGGASSSDVAAAAKPGIRRTERRGSVYNGFGDMDVGEKSPTPTATTDATQPAPISLPPPPPPPTGDGGGNEQWEEMDFSTKRSKLGASINLNMMRPGAPPPVGLRRSIVHVDNDPRCRWPSFPQPTTVAFACPALLSSTPSEAGSYVAFCLRRH